MFISATMLWQTIQMKGEIISINIAPLEYLLPQWGYNVLCSKDEGKKYSQEQLSLYNVNTQKWIYLNVFMGRRWI